MTAPQLSPPAVVGNAIQLPVVTDPDVLTAEGIAYLQAIQPGWTPHEGQLDVAMIEVFARMVANAARVMTTVPLSIFQYLGQQLFGIPPLGGQYATMNVQVTTVNNFGYTIGAGTQVLLMYGPNQSFLFQFAASLVIPPGSTTGTAVLVSANASSESNGVLANNLVLVDGLAGVDSIVCTDSPQAPTGGADAETQTTYLDRLRREISLLTPRPILAGDFATIALNQVGVARAVALDGYNPGDGTANNSLMVTVCAVDAGGEALGADHKNELIAYLEATRSVNWVVHVIDPTYTTVNVTAQINVKRGYSLNDVKSAVAAAITNYVSSRYWGASVDSDGNPTADWYNTTVVRQLGVVGAISNIPGLAWVDSVSLSAGNASPADQDVNLSGPVPLTTPGNINVAATYS
ncbi:baseplate J/gp47 family protein [Actinomycetospora endophytica]|uniref:Baseplate J/gp47 family protein n=1 Tax=Actinomycetospora endophytica TaxID=2291215 RepID=A0ABS8P5K5_9PSEU|nr:baseplate J/gp47 family protein [Actinomycetospora endophytica]MCD2193529.1 baseplate J/gp47 family protein [Actinomycetospora endophytica]